MIQIFGVNKSFDCKSALRWFKERRVEVQFVDLTVKEMSAGEFESVVDCLRKEKGSREESLKFMINEKSRDYASIAYLDDGDIENKLLENQVSLLKLPVCRNGKTAATVGLDMKTWESWIKDGK